MELSLENINIWVESTNFDDDFDSLMESDPDWFEHQLMSICDDWAMLKFASNRNSTKRAYFANLLAQSLSWIYRPDFPLPFHFSRLRGLMQLDEYKTEIESVSSNIFEKCKVLAEMQKSAQEEIKNLSNKILDFRHDKLKGNSEVYYDLIKLLNQEVQLTFK